MLLYTTSVHRQALKLPHPTVRRRAYNPYPYNLATPFATQGILSSPLKVRYSATSTSTKQSPIIISKTHTLNEAAMCYYAVSLFICGCELRKFERCSHQPTSSHIIEDIPKTMEKACWKCQPRSSLVKCQQPPSSLEKCQQPRSSLGKCQQPPSSIGKRQPRSSLGKRKRGTMSARCAAVLLMGMRRV